MMEYASSRLPATFTPSGLSGQGKIEITTLSLFGSGFPPMDWKVIQPITTGHPVVVWRKYLMSSAMCQRRALDLPIALLSAMATMIHFSMIQSLLLLNGDGGLDGRPGVIALKGEILVHEIKDTLDVRVQPHPGKGSGLP